MSIRIIEGDALDTLRSLPDASAHCCVTSPPYWGLRDYGVAGQLGLESTPREYVEKLVAVFAEVRRVLRDDGTLWLNLGDSYNAYNGNAGPSSGFSAGAAADTQRPKLASGHGLRTKSLKPKDLVGVPWRVAFALQADGWWLRSDIIWAKPNPMPESVRDRPTKAHEYVFLLSKSERYHFNAAAVREADAGTDHARNVLRAPDTSGNDHLPEHSGIRTAEGRNGAGRNIRSVWNIATTPFPGSHFATMPPELAERCIKAGCPVGGTVLDPFAGAGTTLLVADRLGRDGIGIELNPEYAAMARARIYDDAPLLASVR